MKLIEELIIKGFRQYKNKQKIEFTRGLNLIQGENNAGKTTIFYALEYCLFGSVKGFPSLISLKNWDDDVKEIEISIIYRTKDNKKYRLLRKHNFSKKTAVGSFQLVIIGTNKEEMILLDNERSKVEDLQELLVKQLGFTRRMFQIVINSKQGSHRLFLDGDKQLDILFGITASNRLATIFKNKSKSFYEEGSKVKQQLEEKNVELASIIQENKERIKEVNEEIKNVNKEITDLQKKIDGLKDITFEKFQQIKSKLSNKEKIIVRLESSLKTLNEGKEKLLQKYGEISSLNTKIDHEKSELEKLKLEIGRNENDKKSVENQIKELNQKIGDTKGQIKRRSSQVGKEKCDYCGSTITENFIHDEITHLEEKNEKFDKLLSKSTSIKETTTKELTSKQRSVINVNNRIRMINDQIKQIKESEVEIEKKHEALKDEKNQILNLKKNLETVTNELLGKIEKLLPKLVTSLKEALNGQNINHIIEEMEKVSNTINIIKSGTNTELRGKKTLLNERLKRKTEVIKIEERYSKELKRNLEEIKKAEKNIELAGKFDLIQEGFTGFLNEQRTTLKKNLEERIRNWYNELAAKKEFVRMEIDPSNYRLFVISPFSKGQEPVLASRISGGGHQTLLALAYKLAVAESVGRPPMLLIDEPTDGTDAQNLENLLDRIQTMSNVFSQTFMITHHGLAAEMASNIVQVDRKLGYSKIKQS